MANAGGADSSNNPKVHFGDDPIIHSPSSSCYTSSSCSSSGSSLEAYAMNTYAVDSSLEIKEPGLIEFVGPMPSSEVNPQTNLWSFQSTSSSHSPPIPLASGRPSVYDPSRIPSAVFAAKPSSAMDWSVASNESLFSIHVGNTSFSRDQQYYAMMTKSGELGKLDEIFSVTKPLPSVTETVETKSTAVHIEEQMHESDHHCDEGEDTDSVDNIGKDLEEETVEDVGSHVEKDSQKETKKKDSGKKDKLSPVEDRSNESIHSSQSFQFPLLPGHDHHHGGGRISNATEDQLKPPLEQVKEEKQETVRPNKKQESDQSETKTSDIDKPIMTRASCCRFCCFFSWCSFCE